VWFTTRKVVRGLFVHHAFDHAATMAFYFFLGSIPLLVALGLLVGSVVQREGAEELAGPLYRAMPRAASELLRRELYAMGDTSAPTLAPLSALGFVWLTTNGIHNLMDVFELLVGAQPRSWLRQRLIACAWVFGSLATFASMTWLLLAVNGFAARSPGQHLPSILRHMRSYLAEGWHKFGVVVVLSIMLSLGLALFYRTSVRHPPSVKRHVWTGTFVALGLWLFVSWGFATYVRTIAHYAVFYGSLATVAVILLWLYLTSLALLAGAEVNVVLENSRGIGRDEA
jgi:membrane protein